MNDALPVVDDHDLSQDEQAKQIRVLGHQIDELRGAIQRLYTRLDERFDEQNERIEDLEDAGQLRISFEFTKSDS